MIFRSVRQALQWYARAVRSDGVRSVWPSPDRALVAQPHGGAGDQIDRFLTQWAIYRALDTLPVGDRRLLALMYIQGLPVLDIAARWDRNPSRIWDRAKRARGKMEGILRAEGLLQ